MKNVQALHVRIYLNLARHHLRVVTVCLHNYFEACTEDSELVESRTLSFSISVTTVGSIVSFLLFILIDENCIQLFNQRSINICGRQRAAVRVSFPPRFLFN